MLDPTANLRCPPRLRMAKLIVGSVGSFILSLFVSLAPGQGLSAADEPPRSSPAAKAAYTTAAALQNRGAWDLAAEAWGTLLRDHPLDPLAAKGRYYLGLCRLQEGKWPEAAEAFRAVVDSRGQAGGADAETALAARFELGRGAFAVAQGALTVQSYSDAVGALREYLAAMPDEGQAAEASHLLAEALWQAGDRTAAVGAWLEFVRDRPASPRLPAVLYALGVAQAEMGEADAAAATLRRLAESFPADELADEVAIRRSDLALAAEEPAEAARLVVDIARRQDGPRVGDALERLGRALWQQKRYAAAAAAYDLLLARDPEAAVAAPALLSASAAWSEAGRDEAARQRLGQLLALAGAPAGLAAEGGARLARMELDDGNAEAAVAAAEGMLARAEIAERGGDPVDPAVIARLELSRAEGLVDLPGRRDEGLAVIMRLVAEHPGDPAVAPGLGLAASVLLTAGRSDEAIAAADRFLALPVKQRGETAADAATVIDVRAIRAEALLAGGDATAAAEAFRGLLSDAGDDPRAPHLRLRWGVAQAAAEDWEGAHTTLGPLIVSGGEALEGDDRPLGLLLDATALVELARAKEAVVLLERIAQDHPAWPRQAEGQLLAVRARREAGDAAGAVVIGEQLLAGNPAAAIAERGWFRLGQAREDAGDPAGAIAAFGKSRRIAPQGPRVAAGLLAEGWCHEALGSLDLAIGCWTEVVDHHPDSAALVPALLARGDARQRLRMPVEGLADAEVVLGLAAAHDQFVDRRVDAQAAAEARFLAGLCLAASGKTPAAIDTFSELLAATPDFPAADRVLLELGLARSLTGDAAGAELTFEELRRRFPHSPRQADAWLERGEMRFAAGDWEGATEAYGQVLAAAPQRRPLCEQARHKRGWVFAMQQDYAGAAGAFAEQLAEDPDGICGADGRAMLGDSLFRLGRFAEAEAVLARALAAPEALSSPDLVGVATVRAAECAAKGERWEESFGFVDRWLAAVAARGEGEQPGRATVWQGRFARAWALQNLGRLEAALAEYRALADAALEAASGDGRGPGELAARARLMEGEILFEQGQHKEAIAAFFKVAYGFGETDAPAPFHPWQAQATFEAARCFEVLAKPEQARGLYAEVVDRYPASPYVAAARKRLDALVSDAKRPVK